MLTFNRTRERATIRTRTRRYLEAYLKGRNQADHPPLSPRELHVTLLAIRRQVAEDVERE